MGQYGCDDGGFLDKLLCLLFDEVRSTKRSVCCPFFVVVNVPDSSIESTASIYALFPSSFIGVRADTFTICPRLLPPTWFSPWEARNTTLQQALAICSTTVYHRNAVPVVSRTLSHSAGLLSLFSWRKAEEQQQWFFENAI